MLNLSLGRHINEVVSMSEKFVKKWNNNVKSNKEECFQSSNLSVITSLQLIIDRKQEALNAGIKRSKGALETLVRFVT